jgi:hypothetical protein
MQGPAAAVQRHVRVARRQAALQESRQLWRHRSAQAHGAALAPGGPHHRLHVLLKPADDQGHTLEIPRWLNLGVLNVISMAKRMTLWTVTIDIHPAVIRRWVKDILSTKSMQTASLIDICHSFIRGERAESGPNRVGVGKLETVSSCGAQFISISLH